MSSDERRGYPVDLRGETKRARETRKHTGDFELAAARVVARLTGEQVVLQDDNSDDGMVDVRIEYAGREPGYVEIVTDINEPYSALITEVQTCQQIAAPNLGRDWWITLSAKAKLKELSKQLPTLLLEIQESDELFESVYPDQCLNEHRHSVVKDLATRGVVQLASCPTPSTKSSQINLYTEGIGGPAEPNWTAYETWLSEFLFDHRHADVRRKLAATYAPERHVFIGATFSTDWATYHSLSEDYRDLPPSPPTLPTEITHLWVWAYPLGRCLTWFPNVGWFDPRTRWATA